MAHIDGEEERWRLKLDIVQCSWRITTAAIEKIAVYTALKETGRVRVREKGRSREGGRGSGRIMTCKGQMWEVNCGKYVLCQQM